LERELPDADQLRGALEELHASSYCWARHCCRGDRHQAEDVLQTVYLKVLEGSARFDGRSTFKTWLFAVIRVTAHESRRTIARLLRRGAALAGLSLAVDEPAGALERLCADEEQRRLEGLVAALSERQGEVLRLVFYHDLTVEQAASVMGVSVGSARVHYQRGKDRLRKALEKQGFEHGPDSGRSTAAAL
jgi:RNA polymerase sigma-70 factor (ECF subfamily)